MRRVFLAGLIAIFTVTSSLAAFEVRGLYSATIEVADKGAAERQRAVRAALDQIIAKITGTRGNATADTVVQLRAQADQLVTSERYRRIPFQSDGDGDLPPPRPGYELMLRFDHDRIDAALKVVSLFVNPHDVSPKGVDALVRGETQSTKALASRKPTRPSSRSLLRTILMASTR